jgi:hypothetical protein
MAWQTYAGTLQQCTRHTQHSTVFDLLSLQLRVDLFRRHLAWSFPNITIVVAAFQQRSTGTRARSCRRSTVAQDRKQKFTNLGSEGYSLSTRHVATSSDKDLVSPSPLHHRASSIDASF